MANNFEESRSGAHCMAQVDMCCLIFQTLMITATFGLLFSAFNEDYHQVSNGTVVFIVILGAILILLVAVDCYAITRLLQASSKDNTVSEEQALSWTRFWYYLSIIGLVLGIVSQLIAFEPSRLIGLAIGVSIRVYMLGKVKRYMDALEERVPEIRSTSDFHDDLV